MKRLLLISLFLISILTFFSCASTEVAENTDSEPKEMHEIGKYAGVPPQYREILKEQEEKNAAAKASEEDEVVDADEVLNLNEEEQ